MRPRRRSTSETLTAGFVKILSAFVDIPDLGSRTPGAQDTFPVFLQVQEVSPERRQQHKTTPRESTPHGTDTDSLWFCSTPYAHTREATIFCLINLKEDEAATSISIK